MDTTQIKFIAWIRALRRAAGTAAVATWRCFWKALGAAYFVNNYTGEVVHLSRTDLTPVGQFPRRETRTESEPKVC